MDETMDIKTNNAPKLILLATINYYPAECYWCPLMLEVISNEQVTEERFFNIADKFLFLYLYTNLFFLLLHSFDENFLNSVSSSALSDQG